MSKGFPQAHCDVCRNRGEQYCPVKNPTSDTRDSIDTLLELIWCDEVTKDEAHNG